MAIDEELLTAREAAELLGVSVATLYAYVSRKKLRTQAVPGSRAHRYWRADIERLRGRERRHDGQIRHLRRGSAITVISEEGPLYRGRSAIALASDASLEQVAALLWDVPEGEAFTAALPRCFDGQARMNALLCDAAGVDRAIAMFPFLEQANPHAFDLSPAGLARTGADVLRALTAILLGRIEPSGEPIHEQCARAFDLPAPVADLVRRLLVLAADHGLEPSTFTVRSVASTGVTPWRSIPAGLAVAIGRPGKFGTSNAVRQLVAEILSASDPQQPVIQRIREQEAVPGFHSDSYPQGDPRARALTDYCDAALSGDAEYAALRRAMTLVHEVRGLSPNLPLLASFVAAKLNLLTSGRAEFRTTAAPFLIGRAAGWVAHAREQYAVSA